MERNPGQLESWYATACSVRHEEPLFCTIKALLETTNEGRKPMYTLTATFHTSTDLVNRHKEDAALCRKLDNINRAMESFVSNYLCRNEHGLVCWH